MRLFARLRRAIHRYGIAGTFRRASRLLARTEEHVWYELDLTSAPPAVGLADGLTLVQGIDDDTVVALSRLASLDPSELQARLAQGAELWSVREAGTPAFACWIFRDSTPVYAARGRTLRLPRGVVCLEDSVTAPDHRGRGIAPAAWAAIAAGIRAGGGADRIVTKVELENAPSRRAVGKVGFVEVARMRMRKRGLHETAGVDGEGMLAGHLRRELPVR